MSSRPTFTAAEIKRAAKVAFDAGGELVLEKGADVSRIVIRKVDAPAPDAPPLGPKPWT